MFLDTSILNIVGRFRLPVLADKMDIANQQTSNNLVKFLTHMGPPKYDVIYPDWVSEIQKHWRPSFEDCLVISPRENTALVYFRREDSSVVFAVYGARMGKF